MRFNKNSEGFGLTGIFIIILTAIIIGGAGWFVYSNQSKSKNIDTHNISESSNGTAENASEATTRDGGRNSDAEQKSDLTNNSTSNQQLTQENLDLTVDKAVTATMDSGGAGYHGIAIKLTLKNSTNSSITEGPTNYQIKDANNNVYALHFSSSGGFGKDFIPILVREIQPGQSITGSIFIQIADPNITDYTLFIGSHTYKVTATKLVSFPATN